MRDTTLAIRAKSARHFNSNDLERGNTGKGLSGGVGDGSGSWRLVLDTSLDIKPLAYIRTADGFVTSMHDVVAADRPGRYLVPFLNPGKNRSQVSMLRLVNPQGITAQVTIDGTDDRGNSPASTIRLTIPAGAARTLTVQDMETGARGLSGRFGTGSGKWQLSVTTDPPIHVVNLLRSPSGHLANLSTIAAEGDIEICAGTRSSELVHIPDTSLRAVVTLSLGKLPGAHITAGEIATLHTISFEEWYLRRFYFDEPVESLAGLEHACALRTLELPHQDISDLTPLTGLSALSTLKLSGNLDRNKISDLTPLAGLSALSTLDLSHNKISDLTPLAGLSELSTLGLNNIPMSDSNLTLVAGLSGLSTLFLAGTGMTNSGLALIAGLSELFYLGISDNDISDIGPLVANTGLGEGDHLNMWNLPLNAESRDQHIPALRARGVHVETNGSEGAVGFASHKRLASDPKAATALSHTLPYVPPALSQSLQGFVRILNQSDRAGTVSIRAVDDTGREFGPVSLSIAAKSARHFNSTDLERGNRRKGLSGGVGEGSGSWRLVLDTTLDIQPLAYIRTADGFVTSLHDVIAADEAGRYFVPFFNPGSNQNQASMLRLVNPQSIAAEVTIDGTDDRGGSPASKVRLSIPAGGARTLTVQDLEASASGFTGRFGKGSGKWRLSVTADRPIHVVNLLRSPTGHLANLSTVATEGDIEICTDEAQCKRGPFAITGISDIPLRSLRAANVNIQRMFGIIDSGWHLRRVMKIACSSYTIQCEDSDSRPDRRRYSDGTVIAVHSGTAPYTSYDRNLHNADPASPIRAWGAAAISWAYGQIHAAEKVKILNESGAPGVQNAYNSLIHDITRGHLNVQSLGNYADSFDSGAVVDSIRKAIAEDSLLFTAGWERDVDGNYIPHRSSSRCTGIRDGCLWLQYDFPGVGGGTSYSAPQLSAALASVLAVFPETTYQNLAKLAKACARRTGDGIERLLQEWGGVGVADFTCMKEIIEARDGLTADDYDATNTITINDGHSVTVGQWSLVL